MDLNKKIIQIRENIKEAQNPIIFFDSDCDGTISYLQLKRTFPRLIGYPMNKDFDKQINLVNLIKENTDLIIIIDIGMLTENFLQKIKNKSIIWIDHHQDNSKEQIKKYNINHLNPLNYDPTDNRACSYIAYKICNQIENLPFAVVGSISDYYLLDIISEFKNTYPKEFDFIINISKQKQEELLEFLKNYKFNDENTKDKREEWIRFLIYEANIIQFKRFFDFLYKYEDDRKTLKAIRLLEKFTIREILEGINAGKGFMFEKYNNLRKQYKSLLKKVKLENINKNLFIFEYSQKISFTKNLSEELIYKLKDTKVIIVSFNKTGKDSYICSIRGNDYKVNILAQKAMEGLDGKTGGHFYAAGASIKKKDYQTFKNRIIDIMNEK